MGEILIVTEIFNTQGLFRNRGTWFLSAFGYHHALHLKIWN